MHFSPSGHSLVNLPIEMAGKGHLNYPRLVSNPKLYEQGHKILEITQQRLIQELHILKQEKLAHKIRIILASSMTQISLNNQV